MDAFSARKDLYSASRSDPRCITSLETGCDHIFALTPSGRYRCVYCEQEFKVRP